MSKILLNFITCIGLFLCTTSIIHANQCAPNEKLDQKSNICLPASNTENQTEQQNPTSAKSGEWGAIAIDSMTGSSSSNVQNAISQDVAEIEAKKSCNSEHCQVILAYKNSCAAVATNGINIDIAQSDVNPVQAEYRALKQCNEKSKSPCWVWIPAQCSGANYPDYWGAIAIDKVNGRTSASAQNLMQQEESEQKALEACGNKKDCQIIASYRNSCVVVATNGESIDTVVNHSNPFFAERKAMAMCNKQSQTSCRIWISARCSGNRYTDEKNERYSSIIYTAIPDYWGAIAIDAENAKTAGSSTGAISKLEAEKRALVKCQQGKNCHIVLSYKNSCGAIATDDNNQVSASYDLNPIVAEHKALEICQTKSGENCKIWIPAKCSGVGY